MTLRHMKIFCSVCEHDYNTTKAAENMHMTQPAVSLAIRELEQYYGVMLFDRIGRRLRITETGQKFLEYSTHIINLFNDMEKGMRNWDYFGVLRVGASITIGSQFLPNYVKEFYDRYPGTEVHALVLPSDKLEEKILSGELDVALIEGIPHHPSVISEEYMEDSLAVIVPAEKNFSNGQVLSIEEFKAQKILLREPGSGTREVFDRVIGAAGFTISPIWEAMSTGALVKAVINGLGIAVLPRRLVQEEIERGRVREVRVEGLDFRRKFYMIYHKEKFLTSSLKMFMELCRNYEKGKEG